MQQQAMTVVSNRHINADYYRVQLKGTGEGYHYVRPGQFVMLRVLEHADPLLRRPFSIHRLALGPGNALALEILYRVVGQGTQQLAQLTAGGQVDVLGPLGRGFRWQSTWEQIFIVAGGIGVAPMLFLAENLKHQGVDMNRCKVFLGGRSAEDLLCAEDFTALGIDVTLTTDDGSSGDQCLVTHPLDEALAQAAPDVVYACGPMPMLQCLIEIPGKYNIPCQVSIETQMACGVGACLGCAVESQDAAEGYLHACVDGPVFDVQQLNWELH